MRNSQPQYGYTLIEVLVVTIVIAVMAGFAIPAVGKWVDDVRHRVLISAYFDLFSFARSRAVTARHIVTICPLSSAGNCIDNWNEAISVFPDANYDQKPDLGKIWRILPPPPKTFSARSRTAGRGYFQFAPTGLVHGPSGGIVVCPNTTTHGGAMSYLAVNRGGRLRVEHDNNEDGTVELAWGADINC